MQGTNMKILNSLTICPFLAFSNTSLDSILLGFITEIITYWLYSKRLVCYFVQTFLIYFILFPNISLGYFAHRNADCTSPSPLRAKHNVLGPIKHRQNKLLITSYTRVPPRPSSTPSCSRHFFYIM